MERRPASDETSDDHVWEQVEAVLLGASELAAGADDLDAYLESACGGDAELRSRVERLLEHDGAIAHRFDDALAAGLAGAAVGVLSELDEDRDITSVLSRPIDVAAARPDQIGRYRLTQRLGEGGTGTVYRAEPADGGEAVAIKILRHGPWSPQAGRRFAAERQMLARLDHPHIARLLDGGTTPNGSPYLVMELVDGEPIDSYCARHTLTIEQRLRLFMPVCAAVHEAHRNLIVHRDLKPSNVLVTHDGVPKLLDFGIAKLLEPGAESMTGSQVPMTPRYASPEQLAGGRVTTVSDVYSLGLLLHEILTGRRLFEEADTPAAVLEHRVREVRPERPSLVAPAELGRRLRGDLDRIVGMALAEEPERRYGSAAQLAEDIERHLDRRPVRAQPDTVGYRLSRFARRHQLAVFLGLVLVFAWAIAGLLGWHARIESEKARVESEKARVEAERASQLFRTIKDLLAITDPEANDGDQVSQLALLDRMTTLAASLPDIPDSAEVLSLLAKHYSDLGMGDPAIEHLRRSLEIRRRTLGADDPSVAQDANLLAIAMVQSGDYEGAVAYFREAHDIRRRHFGEQHETVSASLNNLALVHHDLGRYSKARELYGRSLDIDRQLPGDHDESIAMTRSNLGLLDFDEGRYDAAADHYREVIELLAKQLSNEDLDFAEPKQMLALALAEMGGRGDEAETLARESVAIRRRVFGEHHRDVARGLDALGRVFWLQRDDEAAAEPLRAALAMRRDLLGDVHAETAASFAHVGDFWASQGDADRAIDSLRQAVDAYGASLPDRHPLHAGAMVDLAWVLIGNRDCASAEPLLDDAEAIYVDVFEPGAWQLADVRAGLALCDGDDVAMARHRAAVIEHLGSDHRRARRLPDT